MNRLLLSITAVLFASGVYSSFALAETPKDPGPEIINLKMGVMILPFTHKKHQQELKGDCRLCHSKKIGKIEGWGKETAHKICISCHDLEDKGPVECQQCHRK